jgi:HlyD family secretion protein
MVGGVVLAAALAGGGWLYGNQGDPPPKYRTAKVERGPITAAITATGTVNPVITVIVGSQLSGQIVELMADFNTKVKAEQPLARLDTELIEARLLSARADHAAAEAAVAMQRAQIERNAAEIENARAAIDAARAQADRNRALVADAETDRARKEALAKSGAGSAADADRARNAERSAAASLAQAEAQRVSSEAQLRSFEAQARVGVAQLKNLEAAQAQRQAAVRQVEVDLKRSTIRSPIDGVVVQRNVDTGQTVAASLQAPTLFTIAQDLRHMEVHTTVDEADIGRVREAQDVSFTVNAYPSDRFVGRVSQVRLAPTNISNVITYTVVIAADNSQLKLLPGMTATVTIVTDRREEVFKVSNAALRYRPPGTQPAPSAGQAVAAEPGEGGGPSGTGSGGRSGNPQAQAEAMKRTLTETLKLDKGQIEQLDAIFAQSRSEFVALGASGLSADERRIKGRAIREAAASKINAMLNEEQKVKYAELRARTGGSGTGGGSAGGTLWVVGADGLPSAVRVRLGVSDGTTTEIISSQVKVGLEVIIGGGPRGAAPGSGPRLSM